MDKGRERLAFGVSFSAEDAVGFFAILFFARSVATLAVHFCIEPNWGWIWQWAKSVVDLVSFCFLFLFNITLLLLKAVLYYMC